MKRWKIILILFLAVSCKAIHNDNHKTKELLFKAGREAQIGYCVFYVYSDSSFLFLNCAMRTCDSFTGTIFLKNDTGFLTYNDSMSTFLGNQIIIKDSVIDNCNKSVNLKLHILKNKY